MSQVTTRSPTIKEGEIAKQRQGGAKKSSTLPGRLDFTYGNEAISRHWGAGLQPSPQ